MGLGGALLVRRGGDTLHKEQTGVGQHGRDHTRNLPMFGPPRGVKPYSCFGGLMVEKVVVSIVHLPGRGCLGVAATTRVWVCELSNLLTLSTVAMGLLL